MVKSQSMTALNGGDQHHLGLNDLGEVGVDLSGKTVKIQNIQFGINP